MMTRLTYAERFWAKVTKRGPDECWPWQACIDRHGYGLLGRHGRTVKAHRVAYELHFGPIPPAGCVCHRCDNPTCVNPAHLWIGTNAENTSDRMAKGRSASGTRNGNVILTADTVLAIRRAYAAGDGGYRRLAQRYAVDHTTVAQIVRRKTWTHLP